jgi:hypothetical protein
MDSVVVEMNVPVAVAPEKLNEHLVSFLTAQVQASRQRTVKLLETLRQQAEDALQDTSEIDQVLASLPNPSPRRTAGNRVELVAEQHGVTNKSVYTVERGPGAGTSVLKVETTFSGPEEMLRMVRALASGPMAAAKDRQIAALGEALRNYVDFQEGLGGVA